MSQKGKRSRSDSSKSNKSTDFKLSNKYEKDGNKMIEDEKKTLVLRFTSSSETINNVLSDIAQLKGHSSQGNVIRFTRKNDVQPFEDESAIERLCNSSDASLFAYGSHSKKRPNNLVLGRLFDEHLLDMIEFGVNEFIPLKDFVAKSVDAAEKTEASIPIAKASSFYGAVPCMMFVGDGFLGLSNSVTDLTPKKLEILNTMKVARDFLLDFFKGRDVTTLDLASIDAVMVFTGTMDGNIYFRNYRVGYSKKQKVGSDSESSVPVPKVVLSEMGPSLDLVVRRSRLAAPELAKQARKQPAKLKGARKVKNLTRDEVRGNIGKVHVGSGMQNLSKLVTRSRFSKILR